MKSMLTFSENLSEVVAELSTNCICALVTSYSPVCYGFNRDKMDQRNKFGTLIP